MHKSAQGFSIIEVILVVAIVGILSLMGTIFYTRFLTQNNVSNTTDHIISQMRKAQIYAMEGKHNSGNWGVRYTTSPQQVTLYLEGNAAFDENYSINSNITITNTSATPATFDLTFAHLTGIPNITSPPLVITIVGNNSQEQISINSQGVVSKL